MVQHGAISNDFHSKTKSGSLPQVESLAKKYEEKCRKLGDVASKLTIEEATFRDLQVVSV